MAHAQFPDSSAVTDVTYDAKQRWLFVRFKSGDWYAYFDAPPSLYRAFLAAESKGRFFQEQIRDRYRYELVEDAPA
jgi:hypothetical protein